MDILWRFKEDNNMKKIFALMMALMMAFGCTSMAYAAEVTEPVDSVVQTQEDVAVPYATGVTWQYSNGEFVDSTVRYFTSTVSGKVRIAFGGKRLDGVTEGTITVRLFVKNANDQWVDIATYTTPADGNVTAKVFNTKIYEGDSCMVTIEVTSTKTMVVAGYIGAQ